MAIRAIIIPTEQSSEYISTAKRSGQYEIIYGAFRQMNLEMQESYTQVVKLEDTDGDYNGIRVTFEYSINPDFPHRLAIIQVFLGKHGQETVGYRATSGILYTKIFTNDSLVTSEVGYIKEEWDGTVILHERNYEPEMLIH
jgi:hypothetical protein